MIILDASAAVHIVLGTECGAAFRKLMLQGEYVATPHLFVSEIAQTFWKYAQAGAMTAKEATIKAQEAYKLVDEFVADEKLMPEALHEAIACDHSAYNMMYLVLARRKNATLFTADSKLVALCEAAGVDCVHSVSLGA